MSRKFWWFRGIALRPRCRRRGLLKLPIITDLLQLHGNAKEDAHVDLKMNIYFWLEFRERVDMINIPYSAAS